MSNIKHPMPMVTISLTEYQELLEVKSTIQSEIKNWIKNTLNSIRQRRSVSYSHTTLEQVFDEYMKLFDKEIQ